MRAATGSNRVKPPAGQAEAAWLEQCVAKAWDMPLERPIKADVLPGLAILSGLVYFAQYLAKSIREKVANPHSQIR